jgi:preprotein translocase subunit SecD
LLDFRAVETIVAPGPTAPPKKPYTAKAPVQAATAADPAILGAMTNLDCTNPANRQGGTPDDPAKWIVTCDREGQAKYLLQPAFLRGTNVTNAEATLPQNGGGGWQVDLTFDDAGAKSLATTSSKLVTLQPPQNQFGIVLDGLVQSAPVFQQAILGGQAQITGNSR